MNSITSGSLAGSVVLIFTLGSPASAQDFSKSVDLSGAIASALVQSTAKVIADGTPLVALKSCQVGLSATDRRQTVTFKAPDGSHHAYSVASDVVRKSASGATGAKQALNGTYVVALYYADHEWQQTAAGQKHAIDEARVRVVHPYANMQSLYWVYFVPTAPTPRHKGSTSATVGCGPELGYSVDIDAGTVKQLTPAC